ncbi:MAG: alanine dehydrogenase [Planctomycetota bacterium]|nr:alanine dehydrogenase [Planctomycetota bacterium]
MIVGVPKEIKVHEYRVGLLPAGVEELRARGHEVLIESHAGDGCGFSDEDYAAAGAEIVAGPADVYRRADMVLKVKEPQPEEIKLIRPGQTIFTFFHFAADRNLTESMRGTKCIAVAYETITDGQGRLPLLTPMSEVAGKMSIQEGAKYLERPMMGRGILLGGVPGVEPAEVLILGGGIVGTCAAKVAAGLGARVLIADINLDRLRYLDDVMPANVHTIYSNAYNLRRYARTADLVIGAVLIPGAKAPRLITREYLKLMQPGAVIVDVAVDQGGCCETTKPTTHEDPTFIVDGIVHYCVANMPGAVGRTSTIALTNATLPYALRLAGLGYLEAARQDPGIAEGVNMAEGRITNRAVADTFNMEYAPLMP